MKKYTFNNLSSVSRHTLLFIASTLCAVSAYCQQSMLVHSHNDYRQSSPFYHAYNQQVYSIEVDIFFRESDNELLVAHDLSELPTAPTLDKLYIQPLVAIFKENNNKPWANTNKHLQLLIDLKSNTQPMLDVLISKLKAYPEVFDPAVNPYAVRVTITGNVPKPNDFEKYPLFIAFDGVVDNSYTPEQLKRVALISERFGKYSSWDGTGLLTNDDKERLNEVIKKAHEKGKPVRFWGAPDNATVWSTFYKMGIDYINTDQPEACVNFVKQNVE